MAGSEVTQNKPVFSYEQSAFSGGVSCIPDPRLIEQTQFAWGQDAFPTRAGRIRRRNGLALVGDPWDTSMTPEPARAVRSFIPENGALEFILVWHGAKLTVFFPDGTSADIVEGLDTTRRIAHEEWAGEVFYSDGVNGLRKLTYYAEPTFASYLFDFDALNAVLYVESKVEGPAGNNITLEFIKPGASHALTVAVPTANHVVVTLATDSSDVITSTAAQVKAAVEAYSAANALVTVVLDGDGSGLCNALAETNLVGGYDAGTIAETLVTSAFSFAYLAKRMASERLFGIDADDPTNLRWCDAFAPQTWGATSIASPGGVLVACGELQQAFIVATDELLYRIDGTDPQTWQMSPVPSDGVGCRAADTFIIVEGKAVYWSSRGLAYYDGASPKVLSDLVYDPASPERPPFPSDYTTFPAMFCFTTGIHLWTCYSSDDELRCDRAMVYDFRLQAWGGPYVFQDALYCGTASARSATGAMPHFGSAGRLLRETTHENSIDAPAMIARFISIDGARPLMDKIFNEVRVGITTDIEADGAPDPETDEFTDVTVRLLVDGTYFAEQTYHLTGGTHVIRKRIKNARGKQAQIEVQTTGRSEVFAVGADCFFVRAR